ncbi:lipase secretion chaperone [Marinobacter sp. CHS3-4]|uniref:lipase secretion chaperone n=1 Tax=Marinobacter sp. CHS3-4 TaxID=3045174 RepID=UPI0024B6152B|nr:lipase secretion chaperone [Marinobacter sp. CHS3-4]MDI9244211.1 lipase secretion chaperone [Marinobacter sp. CHS3-4]
MPEQPSTFKRAIFPLIALVPLVAATIWMVTEEPGITPQTQLQPKTTSQPVDATKSNSVTAPPALVEQADGDIAYQTPESLGDDPFASSLSGTDIDGSLKADQNGNLVVDLSTKDFFDYFLNTVGEVSPETALGKIESLARDNLPPAAAEQALAILDQYLDYKQQALDMGNRSLDPTRQQDPAYQLQMLKTALSDLKQLRRNTFEPATHDAFFGLEEAYGDYTLASIEIQQRDDLSAQSKQTLLKYHREQLPEQIRKTETRMIQETDMAKQRQAAIADASSPEEAGENLRDLGVTATQANEVVRYLQEREQFDQQFQQYQQELASLQNAGISQDDFEAQQTQLLERHFESEQTRTWAKLKSLDRSGDSSVATTSP